MMNFPFLIPYSPAQVKGMANVSSVLYGVETA